MLTDAPDGGRICVHRITGIALLLAGKGGWGESPPNGAEFRERTVAPKVAAGEAPLPVMRRETVCMDLVVWSFFFSLRERILRAGWTEI